MYSFVLIACRTRTTEINSMNPIKMFHLKNNLIML